MSQIGSMLGNIGTAVTGRRPSVMTPPFLMSPQQQPQPPLTNPPSVDDEQDQPPPPDTAPEDGDAPGPPSGIGATVGNAGPMTAPTPATPPPSPASPKPSPASSPLPTPPPMPNTPGGQHIGLGRKILGAAIEGASYLMPPAVPLGHMLGQKLSQGDYPQKRAAYEQQMAQVADQAAREKEQATTEEIRQRGKLYGQQATTMAEEGKRAPRGNYIPFGTGGIFDASVGKVVVQPSAKNAADFIEIAPEKGKALGLQPDQNGKYLIPKEGIGPYLTSQTKPIKETNPDQQVFDAAIRSVAAKHGLTVDPAKGDLMAQLPVEFQSEAALEHKRLNSLPPSELDNALKKALLQTRNETNARNDTTAIADIKPGSREFKVAQDLAYGKLTMQQFRSMTAYSRDTNKKFDIYNKAGELNPNFNPAAFEMGYTLAKNPKVQQQLAALDNVVTAVPDLIKFSDAATRAGATVLNKFVMPGGIALGGKKYSNFNVAQIAFADELSGALGFGSATDMSREMGFNMTDPHLSPENFSAAVQDVVVPFIERKRGTMLKQMGIYGQPDMNPAAPPQMPATQPNGGRGNAGGPPPNSAPGFAVTDPRGVVHHFPTQQQADKFKLDAGIR